MNIADAKTKYFESKEHYLAMRKAFAEAYNNPDIHLESAHFLLYNLLRGKDASCGFKDRTNLRKIYHQGWVNLGLNEAQTDLYAWARRWPEKLLSPFGGTVSQEVVLDIAKLMPMVKAKREWADDNTFEEWVTKYVQKEMQTVAESLLANQKPLEPDMAQALHNLITTGEAYA